MRGGGVVTLRNTPPLAPPYIKRRNTLRLNFMLTLIAAVSANNVIGNNGAIPWNIPQELQLFKRITTGHPVIMGRNTFESIGHELPGRQNIVLSHNGPYSSIKKAVQEIGGKDAFVIGGASVYAQMMPLCSEMRISHIKASYKGDTYFPAIDSSVWNIAEQTDFPFFTHIRYTRI